VRKLATPLVLLCLAVLLMAVGVSVVAAKGPAPQIIVDGQMTLRLTSPTSGVTFSGNTLECPPMSITASSGVNQNPCLFRIESVGAILPSSVAVSMTVSGITAAEASAEKFAIDRHQGPLIHFQATSQTIYAFTGAQLPATVDPAVVWGANAGRPLDNSDLGATIVVTYTVVAQSLEGVTATPTVAATATPFQSLRGATGAPGQIATPPPTAAANGPLHIDSIPLFALLICFLFSVIAVAVARLRRRGVRR
jgi:hypothetical protein